MSFLEIQKIFNRAFWLSFSKHGLMTMFLGLLACGLLAVFCRGLGVLSGSGWLAMSFAFIPIFLSISVLLFLSIPLIRLYHDKVKNRKNLYRSVLTKSLDLMLNACALSLPLIFIYLFFWVVLGVFYLLKEIPGFGEVLSVIFAFAPFLLILGSLLLSFMGICLLFFATPSIALKGGNKGEAFKEVVGRIKSNILGHFILLILGLLPTAIVTGFLMLAVVITDIHYLPSGSTFQIIMEWFFIMIPFALILSPAVLFFFNFAAESHSLLKDFLRN